MFTVSLAIISSSLVGISRSFTLESSVDTIVSLPFTLFFIMSEANPGYQDQVQISSLHINIVFTYAGCKYDSIYAVHFGNVCADVETNLLCENLQRQCSSFVSFCYCFLQISEVAGNAGNTQYTGFLVKNFVGCALRQILFLSDISYDCRVDISASEYP